MLSTKDIALLRGMFCDVLRDALEVNNEMFGRQLRHEIRDEIHSVVNAAVFASEERMMKRMDEMQEGIIEVINDGILPQIEENRVAIVHIQRRLDTRLKMKM